ncbi:RadC family protein [Megasphaera elsdenii]
MTTTNEIREKMAKYGENTLTDAELLSLLVGNGVKNQSSLDIAKSILEDLPKRNLSYLPERGTDDFKAVYGIGDKGAGVLVAAIELGKRIAREQVKSSLPDFSTPTAVAHYVMEDMRHLGQEQFCVALLNVKNGLIAVKTLSKGSLNMSLAKARDVFKEALRYNAAAVILIHNHPSGNPEPSQEDIVVTKRIASAGDAMEIPVYDHIIIGDGTFTSLSERGYL